MSDSISADIEKFFKPIAPGQDPDGTKVVVLPHGFGGISLSGQVGASPENIPGVVRYVNPDAYVDCPQPQAPTRIAYTPAEKEKINRDANQLLASGGPYHAHRK